MATPAILNFDRLLAPISDEQPTGSWWREDPSVGEVYQVIKQDVDDSRKSERLTITAPEEGEDEKSSLPATRIDPPKWGQVISRASEALATKTKDLWLAAWLIEGLSRQPGKEFAGMRDGFRLVRELAERYWGQLHPPADEEAIEQEGVLTTVVQLSGLNGVDTDGTLVMAIRRIELIDDAGQLEDVEQCREEFRKMTLVLDEKCGRSPDGVPLAPPSTQIQTVLESCREKLRTALGVTDEIPEEPSDGSSPGVATTAGKMTRESAFGELLRIAAFFEKTEPHSPISYSLRQAVNWGRMSLPELLVELVPNTDARENLFKRTGIPEPNQ
jgi:type VI secretion system protein ImpA